MQNILITGASRGLGRALVTAFLTQPNTNVIAAVRNPDHEICRSLASLARGQGTNLITLKIDSLSDTDARDAVSTLSAAHRIAHLDVVVANAGFGNVYGDMTHVQPGEIRDLVDINALGPLRLFQATRELLEKAERPQFVLMGTPIASIAAMEKSPFPMVAYGASKAAAHYLTRKIHCENERLTAFVLDPGFMQTDMGNDGARHFGYEQAFVPVADSTKFVVEQIKQAKRETVGGKFVSISRTSEDEFLEW